MTLARFKPLPSAQTPPANLPGGSQPAFLHEFFEQAARHWPDRIAIDVPPSSDRTVRRQITYAELQRMADHVAAWLRAVVAEECVVAALLPRNSVHLYAAQLGVLKAGAAHVCIDPAFPDAQVAHILADARPVAVLTDEPGLHRGRSIAADAACLQDVVAWIEEHTGPVATPSPARWLTPRCLAYIIYTSGTTGRAKGVMIEHAGIVNLIQSDVDELGIVPADRVGQSSSCSYDSSIEETWCALATGATLVVMDDETTRLGPDLIGWLRRERITVLSPSPTLLRATGCTHPNRELPDLRLVYVGGEALPADIAERWAPGRTLINGYGPTECAVTPLRGRIVPGGAITIGQPIAGVQAWVLNDALDEVPDGTEGELCIGGMALARGYLNQPALTAQRFPHHLRLGRIYRTGDLVHRDPSGLFHYHGRFDTQVKIRGYRIELEAIEACLSGCAGVRAAACGVQGDGAQRQIAAFIVPANGTVPDFDDLRGVLRRQLPEYMVPGRFGVLTALPMSPSGKLDRRALPLLDPASPANGVHELPRTPMQTKLAAAVAAMLGLRDRDVAVDADFFNDLGGNSLLAAQVISRLRSDPACAALTVRDLYETRTVAALADRAVAHVPPAVVPSEPPRGGRPVAATMVQALWLTAVLSVSAPVTYIGAFHLLPALTDALGIIPLLLVAPLVYLAAMIGYTVATAIITVLVKKALIGRYRPLCEPIWGSFYVRNWIVQHTVRLVPWRLLQGTVFQQVILRALGARIGRRVHIHRGVNLLEGGWDLLDIGDDVTLNQDAVVQLVQLDAGQFIVGPVALGSGSTLEVRAGIGGHTRVAAGGYLTALSYLPPGQCIGPGERWDGVPARHAGAVPERPPRSAASRDLSPSAYGLALLAARLSLGAFLALPIEALALLFVLIRGVDATSAAAWIAQPSLDLPSALLGMALIVPGVPLTLLFTALAARAMGRVRPGVISRWSLAYMRIWLKAELVQDASRWLTGTLLWPWWLRAAGMTIGRGCEISSIIDTTPELVEIGPTSFLADGIYLGGPRIHRGTVTLAAVRLGPRTYIGNNAVIAPGQSIAEGVLLGVSTPAGECMLRPDTAWFGQPPFELPRREIVPCDHRLTHAPIRSRYVNRVFWELLRFALPIVPLLLMFLWFRMVAAAQSALSVPVLLGTVVPALDLSVVALLCVFGMTLKWALLGRVKPGVHPLWSCWCCRWEFHYIAWDLYVAGPLSALEGTLLLNMVMRAMGMRIGRRVALGTGSASIIDHDMLALGDSATVSCMFQAHTFEDRVLKIDKVTIRPGATVGTAAVLLYGADIGARARVLPHSVVMKHERLLPGQTYAGCPTHLVS